MMDKPIQSEFDTGAQMEEEFDPMAIFSDPALLEAAGIEGDEVEEEAPDQDFHKNIIDEIDSDLLKDEIADLAEAIKRDRETRQEYDDELDAGIKELGFERFDATTAPFAGASTVKAPMIAKAALRYQAHAKRELFPQSGAARALTYKDVDGIEEVRLRAEQYVNYQLSNGIPGYAEDMDRTLMMLSLYGSVFRKVYFDGKTTRVDMIPVQDFLVPWSTKDLESCPRKTHILRLHKHEVEANFRNKLWKKADLADPDESSRIEEQSAAKETMDRVIGLTKDANGDDDRYVIYEVHAWLTLEEDEEQRPYIVTFDAQNHTPLAVVRNWKEDSANFEPRSYFVHYKFLPWNGFYGIGFIQILMGLQKAATGSLRSLQDKAMQANMTGGLIAESAVMAGQNGNNNITLSPNEWVKVRVNSDGRNADIRNIVYPWSSMTGEPSGVMLQNLQWLMQQGDEFGSININEMAKADKQAPVGTILAMIEQQGVIYSSIHERQHRSLGRELELIQATNYQFLGGEDGAETVVTINGSLSVDRNDFGPEIRVVCATDPALFTAAQRVSQAQAILQLAQQAKGDGVEVDMKPVYQQYAVAIGMKEVDKIFPEPKPPEPPPAMDPVSEFRAIMTGQPVIAHKTQNHMAHVQYLNNIKNDPFYSRELGDKIQPLEALIADHVSMQAMVEAEGAMGAPLPTGEEAAQLPPEVQVMVAQAVAAVSGQMMKNRPPQPGDPKDVLKAETERKNRLDAMNAQLRIADIQQRGEDAAANRQSKESIELAKLQLQREEMTQDSSVVAAQVTATNQQKATEIANKREVDLARIQTQRDISEATNASREQIAATKVQSDQLKVDKTTKSKEDIEAAKLNADDYKTQVDITERHKDRIINLRKQASRDPVA